MRHSNKGRHLWTIVFFVTAVASNSNASTMPAPRPCIDELDLHGKARSDVFGQLEVGQEAEGRAIRYDLEELSWIVHLGSLVGPQQWVVEVITQLGERVGRGCRSLGEDSDRMMRLKERLERFGNSHDAEGWVTECADLMEVISEEKERWPQFETKLAPYKVRGKKAAKSFGRKGDQVYFNGIGWKAKAPRPRNYPQGRLHH